VPFLILSASQPQPASSARGWGRLTADTSNHRPNGPETSHALTIKPD